mgnify:CR=1 FL=1
MKYIISGIKKTPIAKKDGSGTWMKVQVKTQQTGTQVLDLGFSISKNIKDNLVIGSEITGYVEARPWSSNGKSGVNMTLNGITVEYVYELLLKMNPTLEGLSTGISTPVPVATKAFVPENIGWDGIDETPKTDVDEEVGF